MSRCMKCNQCRSLGGDHFCMPQLMKVNSSIAELLAKGVAALHIVVVPYQLVFRASRQIPTERFSCLSFF